MKALEVAKGTFHVSKDAGEVLVARNLGSGLAICIKDGENGVFGICSLMVPLLKKRWDKEPFSAFECGQGLKEFFRAIMANGAAREGMEAWLVGVGQFLECPKDLNVGVHVYALVKKTLEKNGVPIKGEFVGGPYNKTVRFGLDMEPDVTVPGSKKES